MRARAKKALARSAQALGLGGVFAIAAAYGVVLHADMKVTRRAAASIANEALATVFLGRIAIGEIKELHLGPSGHVRVAQVEIFDPEGHRVLFAKDVTGRIDLAKLVTSLLTSGTPEIALAEARIDEADVLVDVDAKGDLGIARAFFPRPSATPAKPAKAAAGEAVRLAIPNARLRHAWVHGNVVPPRLDADTDDVRARVFISENRVNVEVDQAITTVRSPRGPGQAADVHGHATGGITVPLSDAARAVTVGEGGAAGSMTGGVTMHWELVGDAAGIPLLARLGIDGDVLDASADIAAVEPEVVRRAFPALPLTRPLELHAKVHGKLPTLGVTLTGRVGTSTITGQGEVGLRESQAFHFDADLGAVDGAAFAGPASDVSGHVHVEGAIAGGAPTGTFKVTTMAGAVLSQSAPAVDAAGTFDSKNVVATFRASEPGVDVDGSLHLDVPAQSLGFDVNARSKNLRGLARAPGLVGGSGTAHAKGSIDLARSTIDAHVTADGTGLTRAPASVATVHADAVVTGPLASPVIDVTARAKDVRLAAAPPDTKGEKHEPLTYPSATVRARVLLDGTPRIVGAELHVDGAGGESSIDATATEVLFGPGGVDVRGGRVTGLGAPLEIEVGARNGATSLRAKGTDVDVQRVAATTGIRELRMLPEGSRASFDIDLKATSTRTDGHADVTIAGAKDGTAAEVHATLVGRRASVKARVAVGSAGWVELQGTDLDLPAPLGVSTLKQATGALDLRGEVDLAQGAALFGGESIEQVSGRAFVSARVERFDAHTLPAIYATARTQNLDVTFNRDGKSTHVAGIDGSIHVGYDGLTDETAASVLTWDRAGILGSAEAKSRVPLVAWVTGATPFDRAALDKLEIAGAVDVPPRDVSELPGIFARPDLHGTLSLHAGLAGSVNRPSVTLLVRADDLTQKLSPKTQLNYAPIDGLLEARWDGRDVVATLRMDESERAQLKVRKKERKSGHVRGLVIATVPLGDILAGRPLAWNASGELDVADLELAPLPLPMNLRGALTGRVKVRDVTGTPELDARARVDDLGIAGVRVLRGDLRVEAKNGSVSASARVNQADGGSGRLNVTSSALQWRGADVEWDAAQPTRIEYVLDRMRLDIVRPFVRRSIPEIDGVVDGRGSATATATTHVFEGGVSLTGGRLYVNALGEEVTDVSAVARFESDGAFRIQDASAKIGSGEVKASAAGRMKGLRFESVDLVAVVPSKDGVPLSSEGATFAQANGEVRLAARMAPDGRSLAVSVNIPRAKVTVPSRGTQKLQPLDADKFIAIGVRQSDGRLAAPALRPGEARRKLAAAVRADAAAAAGAADGIDGIAPSDDLLARFTVNLGEDIELEGRGVRIYLTGRTIIDLGNEIAMTGQIALKQGGTIDVQGRKFVVDRGTVSFARADDPADPIVIAAAYWDAPDRTRIWVEFNGPLKTGKLTLRSEPAYSKNEILSIMLFGRADPNQGRAGDARPSDTQAATDVGAGVLSSGLNQALGDLDEDFDLEQDKTGANRTRTKVGYRLRRNLKVQIGYAAGFSQREPDTTYLFLEWQFVPKWSVIGTRGDRGTSILDVLFQHRY
jgi:translocation and assembly module TamB